MAEAFADEEVRLVLCGLPADGDRLDQIASEMTGRAKEIITIASSSAYFGYAGTSVYCASKHGLLGLCRSMHEELRPFGVRVSVIAPSDTDTPGYRAYFTVKDESNLIQPEELARTAVFLARSCGQGPLTEVRVTRMRG